MEDSLDASGVSALIKRGQNILNALTDESIKVAENQNDDPQRPDVRAAVTARDSSGERPFSNTVFLMREAFFRGDLSSAQMGRAIAHEADHLENNGIDTAYRQSPNFFRITSDQAANNPDSVLRALQFRDP